MARVLIETQPWGVVEDTSGNALIGQSVHIANPDGTAAPTWSAQSGGTSTTTDQVTGSNGAIPRWIEEDEYDLTVAGRTWRVQAVRAASARISRLRAYGHSYLQDTTGASVPDKAFINIVSGMLGCQIENLALGGSSTYLAAPGAVTRVLQSTLPGFNTPFRPHGQVYVIYTGLNDIGDTKQFSEMSIVTDSIRDMVLRMRAGGVHEVEGTYGGAAGFTRAGTWGTNTSTSINSGTANWQCNANASTWTYKTPTNFPGGTVEIHGLRTLNSGATHAVTLNSVSVGTWDTRGATQSQFRPTYYKIPNVPAGQQTIVGTVSNLGASNEFLDYAQFPSPNPPVVIVMLQARVGSYTNSGTHTIVDADVTTLNGLISSMIASEFPNDPRVVVLDTDAVLNKAATYFGDGAGGGDQLHPNDNGHGVIAQSLYQAINSAVPTLSDMSTRLLPYNVMYAPRVQESGLDPRMGVATLVAGTVTITTYQITASTRIRLTRQTGAGTARGHLEHTRVATVGTTAGTVTITAKTAAGATETNDTSTVLWELIEPA